MSQKSSINLFLPLCAFSSFCLVLLFGFLIFVSHLRISLYLFTSILEKLKEMKSRSSDLFLNNGLQFFYNKENKNDKHVSQLVIFQCIISILKTLYLFAAFLSFNFDVDIFYSLVVDVSI